MPTTAGRRAGERRTGRCCGFSAPICAKPLTRTVPEAATLPAMVPRSVMLRLTAGDDGDGSPEVVDVRYWLAHSQGFRVSGPAGRIGTVMRVVDGDERLMIRTGLLGTHTVMARFDQVARIEPWHEWLSLSDDPHRPESHEA